MKYYLQKIEDVFGHIGSTAEGLTTSEAESRLQKYGKNKLDEGKKKTMLKRVLEQLSDPMIIILIVAALISGALSVYEILRGQKGEFVDVIIILAVVLVNAVLGVFQESKAEKAIEALQEMSAATSKVLRDGKWISIHSEDLVVGDVIMLEAGDAVPAEGRIIDCASL